MARSTTPAYRIETRTTGCRNYAESPMEWRSRSGRGLTGYGVPNNANLETFVEKMNTSFAPGGANAHLRENDPDYSIVAAQIVRQRDGKVMASVGEMTQPLFEAI